MKIFVFGDSLAYGAWDEKGGWALRLRRHFDKKMFDIGGNINDLNDDNYHTVFTLGNTIGENSIGLLKRVRPELDARLHEEDKARVAVFSIGPNDSAIVEGGGTLG
jgi:lysophospholipase L1-like esterase